MRLRELVVAALVSAFAMTSPALAESGSRLSSLDFGKTSAVDQKQKDKKAAARKPVQKKLTARERRALEREEAEAAKARKSAKKKPEQAALPVVVAGNSGELRSENKPQGLFEGLFGGGKTAMLAETRALDSAMENRKRNKKFSVKSEFLPQSVPFSGYPRGTIVIDTSAKFLYHVESSNSARRYAIAVGRDGLQFEGSVKVGDKQEWPRWIPTLDMQKREPKKYGQYKDGMNGGPDNPLGARAIYLYQGRKDTYLRIHGTNQPESIGSASSNGCFRMVNEHVMELYNRVRVGTEVVVVKSLSS